MYGTYRYGKKNVHVIKPHDMHGSCIGLKRNYTSILYWDESVNSLTVDDRLSMC